MRFDQEKALEIVSSPPVVWFILGLVLLFFAVVSIILVYHWRKYGSKSKHIAFAEIVYFPVALVFIGISVFALIMYSTL